MESDVHTAYHYAPRSDRSAHYTADLRTAFNSGNITDLAGNKLVNEPDIIGDFEVLNFTTNGAVVPAAPTLVRRNVQGFTGRWIIREVSSVWSGTMQLMHKVIISIAV